MSNVQRLKRRAIDFEQKRQLDRALELYMQLLDEAGRDLPDDDVPLYNRVGDLLVRKGDTAQALAYYERAVDAYAERGFLNNAIALCNKILRQSPGRASVYYKLGKISARKGFRSDARKNFLEYADRMQKNGNLDEAFRALKEFAALYPEQDDVRLILADLLSRENRKGEALEQLSALYEKLEGEGRKVEARATIERMRAIDPDATVPQVTGEQTVVPGPDTLVFLDVSGEEPRRPAAPTPQRPSLANETAIPGLKGLRLTFVPESEDEAGQDVAAPTAGEPERASDERGETAHERDVAAAEGDAVADESELVADGVDAVAEEPDVVAGEREHAIASDDDEATDDDAPPLDRADEIEVVAAGDEDESTTDAEDFDAGEPVPFEPATADAHDERSAAEEHQHLMEQLPLSGVEFSGLPLTEVQRAQDSRAHDLVVPTALPHLGEHQRNGEAVAESDTAPATEGERARAGDVGTADGYPVIDDLVIGGGGDPGGGDERAGDDHSRAVYRPTPTSGERLTIPSPEELLQTPPSFGQTESAAGYGFPPLPGLTDDEDATPVPEDAFVFDSALADSVTPIDLEGTPSPELGPTSGDAPVDAPLPEGLAAGARDPAQELATGKTPRATLSLGGAEGHLRQRIELDPLNWALHRQLGEVLLDAGERDGGLAALERAMAGFESTDHLEGADEVAEVVLRVQPNSIRHHQKRVEYAVRLKDRGRLTAAYLELADALFRTGEGDKSIVVYSRVAELDPDNERALFALATLAPEAVEALRGAPARRDRWTDELDAFPATLAMEPLPPAPPEPVRATPPQGTRDADAASPAAEHDAPRRREFVDGAPEATPHELEEVRREIEAFRFRRPTPVPQEPIAPTDDTVAAEEPVVWPTPEEEPSPPDAHAHGPPVSSAPASETAAPILPIEFFAADAPEGDRGAGAAPSAPIVPAPQGNDVPPPKTKAPAERRAPPRDAGGGYFDLGDWLRESEAPRSTRMVVEDARPTGDEQADFDELLRRFKRGLAENVDEEDFEAHYDLGVAFKEMGLVDEAIAEFQKALRGSTHRIRAYEALGACFVEKTQYPIAAALLQRAVEQPGTDDQQLVGVLYLLGFANEQLGRQADALRYYQRVFAVDIDFRDVRHRVSAMEHLTK